MRGRGRGKDLDGGAHRHVQMLMQGHGRVMRQGHAVTLPWKAAPSGSDPPAPGEPSSLKVSWPNGRATKEMDQRIGSALCSSACVLSL